MQIQRSKIDPQTVKDDRQRLRYGLRVALVLVSVVLVAFALNLLVGGGLLDLGVKPRNLSGLAGVLTMPLLHTGWAHLLSNLPPLFMMSLALFWLFPSVGWRVLLSAWALPGLLVWLFAAQGVTHVGASGLTFALFGFLSVSGLVRLQGPALAVSLLTLFYYGGMLSGLVPDTPGISWQAHLAGALVGIALAVLLRKADRPAPRVYDWELEEEEAAQPTEVDEARTEPFSRMPDDGHRH